MTKDINHLIDEELEVLRAENKALKEANLNLQAQHAHKLVLRATAKGCVGVYGLRKFAISAYASEWEAILKISDQIQAFIKANPTLPRNEDDSRKWVVNHPELQPKPLQGLRSYAA